MYLEVDLSNVYQSSETKLPNATRETMSNPATKVSMAKNLVTLSKNQPDHDCDSDDGRLTVPCC